MLKKTLIPILTILKSLNYVINKNRDINRHGNKKMSWLTFSISKRPTRLDDIIFGAKKAYNL